MNNRQGWICPRCDRANSPDVPVCECSNQAVVGAATENFEDGDGCVKWPPIYTWPPLQQPPLKWDWTVTSNTIRKTVRDEVGNIIREATREF